MKEKPKMQILKTPKIILSKTPKDFHIKAKCICGCKCLLEDAFDICYISGFKNIMSHALPDIWYGYYCPSCGALTKLSERNNKKITKLIMKRGGVNINKYITSANELNFRFEMGIYRRDKNNESVLWKMVEDKLPLPIYARPEVMRDGK